MLPVSCYLLIPSHLRPLKGDPLIFSYLSRTWESLGPQVTSSVFCLLYLTFVPFPLYSLCALISYLSTCPPSPACCCVPRSPQRLEGLAPHLYCPLLRSSGPLGVAPSPTDNPIIPVHLKLNHPCNSRRTLTRDFYLGGDIRRNFLNPSATTEYVEKTRH